MRVEQQVDALATSVDELTGTVVSKTATLDASVVDAQSATAQAQDAKTSALSARDEAGAFKDAMYTAAQSAASAVAYQDLTALAESKDVTAVDVFIYDTAKDSDGGAWRHRCAGASWYQEPLNTATRGGRREFPAVAVIVAEAEKVTIYDGDDPALPMWMVLQGSYLGVPHRQGGYDYKAVAMINGMMAYTGSNQGLLTLDFIRETTRSSHASTTRGGEYSTPIAQRGVASRFPPPGQSGFTLPSSSGNDLAMTVLASAPVDPATALPVPTIAVATEGGVSVIKDDGTVANTPSSKGASCVVFFGENHVYTSERSPYNLKQRAILAPEYSSTVAVSATIRGGIHFQGPNMAHGIASPLGTANGIAVGGFNTIGGSVKGAKLWRFGLSQSYAPETMGAFLTATYNTGWMPGDIKCAFLSDADDTDLVPVVADEDFSSSTGWTLTANTSISGEQLTIDTTIDGVWYSNATKALDQPTEAGEVYYYEIDIASTDDQLWFYFGTGGVIEDGIMLDTAGVHAGFHKVAEAGTSLRLEDRHNSTGTHVVNSVKIWRCVTDRSVNTNGLIVNGTATRSPVAAGAELVAYSGFSASNYLEQPYNPDLDFGTGDFCVMGWVKTGLATGNTQCILERGDAGAGGNTIKFEINATGALLCQLSGSTVSGGDISSGQFSHACFTKRGGTLYLHVNGDEISTLGAAGKDATNTDALVRIGQSLNGGRSLLDGSLALWRISATAPSAAQIKRIYEDERPMFQEGASCTLYGAADEVTALAHDPSTGLLHVGTPVGRSVFRGLRRVAHTTTPVTTAIAAVGDLVVDQ